MGSLVEEPEPKPFAPLWPEESSPLLRWGGDRFSTPASAKEEESLKAGAASRTGGPLLLASWVLEAKCGDGGPATGEPFSFDPAGMTGTTAVSEWDPGSEATLSKVYSC